MMRICPSMPLPEAKDYIYQIDRLLPYYRYFQLDIADGLYVSGKTDSLDNILKLLTANINLLTGCTFDFHLMVRDFEPEIKKMDDAVMKSNLRVENIFIHFGLHPDLSRIKNIYSRFHIGLTLNPQDSVEALTGEYRLPDLDCIQIMAVIPGAQGRPFIPAVLDKIDQLRMLHYRNNIFLDGAVNGETFSLICSRKFKPDVVCPGSFLIKAPTEDLPARIALLKKFQETTHKYSK